MLKIGLTGGIGCGKTTVAALFAKLGTPIIDADKIAHSLVEPGQPALAKIVEAFGKTIINADGSLNRIQLRESIFTHNQKKQILETILHPLIQEAMIAEMEGLTTAYCILAVPLLFEAKMTYLVDRILVIDCPKETQIQRVQKRDTLSLERLESIINSQVSREFRIAQADDVINNTNNKEALAEQVKKLHNLYTSLNSNQE